MLNRNKGVARLEGDNFLARHASRNAANEAKLIWLVLWLVLWTISFLLRWEFSLTTLTIPMAGTICFALASVIGIIWYMVAHREIEKVRAVYHKKMQETQARVREEHLQTLRARQKGAD